MHYDKEKVDDMMLALMWLTMFDDDPDTRAWKEYNWDHMNRLHEKGYIDNPRSKNRSVIVTEEGKKRAEELFNNCFGS